MPVTKETTATHRRTMIASPIGDLLLVSDDEALTGLFMSPHKGRPTAEADTDEVDGPDSVFDEAVRQLGEYFAGDRQQFDLHLRPTGTPFQLRVWAELNRIPYGETISYGELARRVGSPNGFRAVGQANGRNPISVIVPCHRVIGADGSLAGYGGGADRKRFLLGLEGAGRWLV